MGQEAEEWPDLLLDGGGAPIGRREHAGQDGAPGPVQVGAGKGSRSWGRETILLDRKGRALVHARDEAHRFSQHSTRSGEGRGADPLEVDGSGAKKIQALLRLPSAGGRE